MKYLKNLFTIIKKTVADRGFILTISVYIIKLIYKIIWPIANLAFLAFFSVKNNRLLFESNGDFSDNGRALFEYMIKKGYNKRYEIVWLVEEPHKYKKHVTQNVRFVKKINSLCNCRSLKFLYYACTSKFIFITHSMNWLLMKKKSQTLVNLWHGCGYKAAKGNSEKIKFDYCLVPGTVFVDTKKEFFMCSEDKLLPLGYPRYDYFRNENTNVLNFIREYCHNNVKDPLEGWTDCIKM